MSKAEPEVTGSKITKTGADYAGTLEKECPISLICAHKFDQGTAGIATAAGSTEDVSSPVIMGRRFRVFVFRKWLLSTFGLDLMKSGAVLDVAGGKGDLSWLLVNADGIDSIVVDPRVTDHTKLVRSAQYLLDNPDAAAESAPIIA